MEAKTTKCTNCGTKDQFGGSEYCENCVMWLSDYKIVPQDDDSCTGTHEVPRDIESLIYAKWEKDEGMSHIDDFNEACIMTHEDKVWGFCASCRQMFGPDDGQFDVDVKGDFMCDSCLGDRED